MSEEIDCEFTSDLVCPYCGYVHEDDGEMNESGDMKCYKCEKKFIYEVEYSKSFSSRQVPCMNGEPHTWYPNPHPDFPKYRYCRVCNLRDIRGDK
jgi:hypothetical protein